MIWRSDFRYLAYFSQYGAFIPLIWSPNSELFIISYQYFRLHMPRHFFKRKKMLKQNKTLPLMPKKNRFSWFSTIDVQFYFYFYYRANISVRIVPLRCTTTLSFIAADKSTISIKIQAYVQHWDCYNQYTKSLGFPDSKSAQS